MGDFENIEIIEVLVKEGQSIKKNDSLITLESDKSSVEVPSTLEGVIEKINIKIGDKVNQGDLILTLKTKEIKKSDEILEKKEQVDQSSALKQEVKKSVIISSNQNIKPASPKVRKFARELGSNIMQIPGSQRSGRVSEEDVKKFIKSQAGVNKEQVEKKIYKDEYSHEEFGEVEIKEIPRVKKSLSNISLCIRQNIVALDDLSSDAKTIAEGISSVCAPTIDKFLVEFLNEKRGNSLFNREFKINFERQQYSKILPFVLKWRQILKQGWNRNQEPTKKDLPDSLLKI